MSSVQLGSLGNWSSVVVVDEDSVVVGKELAAENSLVVACNLRVKLSNEKSALSVDIAGKSVKRNNNVGIKVLFEGDLEAELPEGGVG